MSNFYILDDDGEAVPVASVIVWGEWFQQTVGNDRRAVAFDAVAPGVEVSTVFLGIDLGFVGGDPRIFETLVFGGPRDGDCRRYATRADALAGHAAMLAELRAAGR